MVEPSEVDVRAFMRKKIGALREQADTLELALNALEGAAPTAPAPARAKPAKAGRVSNARRPTKGGAWAAKQEALKARALEYRKQHPDASLAAIAKALGSSWGSVKKALG